MSKWEMVCWWGHSSGAGNCLKACEIIIFADGSWSDLLRAASPHQVRQTQVRQSASVNPAHNNSRAVSLISALHIWIICIIVVGINTTPRQRRMGLFKDASSSKIKVKFLCAWALMGEMTGLTWPRHHKPLPGQAHTGHVSTREHTERSLFCGPCAGQRRQVGVKW